MPRRIRKETEIYPEDCNNIFHEFKNYEDLYEYYSTYVRKYGTNDWLNTQYILRKKELDILKWREEYFS